MRYAAGDEPPPYGSDSEGERNATAYRITAGPTRKKGARRPRAETWRDDWKGGKNMSEKSDYIGRIKNAGSQVVEAPKQETEKKTGKVKTGRDLRAGRK